VIKDFSSCTLSSSQVDSNDCEASVKGCDKDSDEAPGSEEVDIPLTDLQSRKRDLGRLSECKDQQDDEVDKSYGSKGDLRLTEKAELFFGFFLKGKNFSIHTCFSSW